MKKQIKKIQISQLAFVIPPFIRPTSPPLGPAVLKAFLKKNHPDKGIRCFDLNLDYFYSSMEQLKNETFKLKLYNWDHIKTSEMVRHSFEFLKTCVPEPGNLKEYHRQATIFLSFENIFNGFMSEMALRALAGIDIPERVSLFFDKLLEKLLNEAQDLIAISVLFDIQMPFALLTAKKIKEKTDSVIILGGAKFGINPSHSRILSQPLVKLFKSEEHKIYARDFIDGIVSGEGEMCLLHILNSKEGKGFFRAPNLFYWHEKKKEVIENPSRVLEDLDELPPPDFQDFALHNYLCPEPVLPVLSARGCPWGRCVFCTHHHSYKRYRQRSIEKLIEDLKYLKKSLGVKYFNFFDEMLPPTRFRKIARQIISQRLDICYSAYGKPVKNFDHKTLKVIRDSGCQMILWGVESASQRLLDLMKKGTDIRHVEQVIRTSANLGIKNLLFVMFGFPGETRQEFYATIKFLQKNRDAIHGLSKGTFRLMEGSYIERSPEMFGIKGVKEYGNDSSRSKKFVYDIERGLSIKEVDSLFKESLPVLDSIGLTPRFGTYRDHLLVFVCNLG